MCSSDLPGSDMPPHLPPSAPPTPLLTPTPSTPPHPLCTGFGWYDRYISYQKLNKLHLGHENIITEIESDTDAQFAERRIALRLASGRLEAMHPPPSRQPSFAGGNSLFEAFSMAVWATPTYHLPLRHLIVSYMRQCPDEYACFLGDDYDAYLKAMSRPGVAGDELILRALADRFGLPITVVTGDEVIWCVRYPPRNTMTQRQVFLAVAPTARFSVVRRQSAITTLKLITSFGNGQSGSGGGGKGSGSGSGRRTQSSPSSWSMSREHSYQTMSPAE